MQKAQDESTDMADINFDEMNKHIQEQVRKKLHEHTQQPQELSAGLFYDQVAVSIRESAPRLFLC